jgi:hypothetical protein
LLSGDYGLNSQEWKDVELRTRGRFQRDLYVMLRARRRYLAGLQAIEVREEYVPARADRCHVGYEVS